MDQPRRDGPFVGWSDNALGNLKSSISPLDFSNFVADRHITHIVNTLPSSTGQLPFKYDYDPEDYGVTKTVGSASTRPNSGGSLGFGGSSGYGGATGFGDPAGYGGMSGNSADGLGKTTASTDPVAEYVGMLNPDQRQNLMLGTMHAMSPLPGVHPVQNPWLRNLLDSRQNDDPHVGDSMVTHLADNSGGSGSGGDSSKPVPKQFGYQTTPRRKRSG